MFAKLFAQNKAAFFFVLVVILAAVALVQFPFSLNHDAAWHFYTATRVLAGDRIGLDIADINPPMAMWLFSAPGLLVVHLGANPAIVFRTFTMLVAVLVCALSLRPLQMHLGQRTGLVLLAVLAAFLLLPAYDFGQREHLAALLVLPYVNQAALRSDARSPTVTELVLIGLLAGVGICFKPYFLAVPASVELWRLIQRRSWRSAFRPEAWTMIGVGIAYMTAVAIFAPDYLGRVVPDAMRTYAGFERSIAIVLVEAGAALALPIIVFLLALIAAPGLHRLAGYYLVAAMGFLVAAILQQKGWAYQLMPAALYVVAAAIVQAALATRFRLIAGVAIASACLVPVGLNLRDQLSPTGTSARVARLEQVLASPEVETVYGFITSPRDMHPAVLSTARRWADAYGVMMFLPAHLAALQAPAGDARAATAIAIAQTYIEDMLARFAAAPPDLLAFDTSPYKLGLPSGVDFDYLAFLATYPGFETLLARYDEIAPVGRFRLFQLRPGN